jgi:hypothetical protein
MLSRDQFNARLANGHEVELFDNGKRCRIVGRDEEAELDWFEDFRGGDNTPADTPSSTHSSPFRRNGQGAAAAAGRGA